MGDHVYKVVELVGSSSKSIEDAIENAIGRAGKTLSNLDWFEVVDTRGHIDGGKVGHYQVTVKVGYQMSTEVTVQVDEFRHVSSQISVARSAFDNVNDM